MKFLKNLFSSKKRNKEKQGLMTADQLSALKKSSDEQSALRKIQSEKSQTSFDNQSVAELVRIIADAPTANTYDRRNDNAVMKAGRAELAMEALHKKIDLDKDHVLEELLKHININSGNKHLHKAFIIVGKTAVSQLISYLVVDNKNSRLNALRALAELKSGEAVDALLPHLLDNDDKIRSSAVIALGYTGHPKAYQALIDYETAMLADKVNIGGAKVIFDQRTLKTALYWANVPETLAELRQEYDAIEGNLHDANFRRARLESTISQLELQHKQYWQ